MLFAGLTFFAVFTIGMNYIDFQIIFKTKKK